MVRILFLFMMFLLPAVVEGQMQKFRLNYQPMMDTIIVDNADTIIYDKQQFVNASFADTTPKYVDANIYTLIFRGIYESIDYKPSLSEDDRAMCKLDSIRQIVMKPIDADIVGGINPLEVLKYRYMIERPSDVKYAWQQIPEVEEKISNRRKRLQENDDYQAIVKMFEQFSSDMSMRKRPEPPKSPWTVSGEENVQISQLFVNKHWAKGGENSMTLISDLRIKAVYSKDKHNWENNITQKLGITNTTVSGTRLSDDVLDMSSKYGYKAISKWYYSFQNTFKTQLFKSYNKDDTLRVNPLSAIMSPAYIQFIFGMDYMKDDLSLLLSPYTAVMTLVLDTSTIDQTRYSVEADKKLKTINGLSVTLNWKKTVTSDIVYTTKLELFYQYFEKNGSKRFNWENVIDVQLNRFLTTRLLFDLRYYDNESDKFQFKENFSIAFKFKF